MPWAVLAVSVPSCWLIAWGGRRLAVIWGLTVIADSAQFSAAVTELTPPGTAGTALTLQTAAGFTLTG